MAKTTLNTGDTGSAIHMRTAGSAGISNAVVLAVDGSDTVQDPTLLAKDATLGSLTETAPASDTASSGLNGRLQRVAQRLTSLIALLPASLGQKAMSASLAVTVASDQGAIATKHAGSTGAHSIVASTVTTNTQLLAADSTRVGALIYNDSTQILFVLLGAGTESATVFTTQIAAAGYYEVPEAFTTMRVSGHWASANGNARITTAV